MLWGALASGGFEVLTTPRLLCFALGLTLSPFVSGSFEVWAGCTVASVSLWIALERGGGEALYQWRRLYRVAMGSGLGILLGLSGGVLQIEYQLAKVLPDSLDKEKAQVLVRLDYALTSASHRSLWHATIVGIDFAQLAESDVWRVWHDNVRGEPIRLAWYGKAQLKAGETWQLELTLRRPRGFVNPKGFDYAAWLLQHGFIATAYSADVGAERISNGPTKLSLLQRLSERLADQLSQQIPANRPSARFFEGLLLGRRDKVAPDDWLVLQRTGTNHLFAISGLHIGLVALLGVWSARLAAGLLPLASYWAIRRHMPVVVGVMLATGYAVVSGMSLPTQRALVVVLLAAGASLLSIKLSLWRLWSWALLVVLIGQPLAPLNAGFWLSFVAVAILLWVFVGHKAPVQSGKSAIEAKVLLLAKAQLTLSLGLAFPLWCIGLPVSLTGPWVNLVAVPVVSLLIVPGLLVWALLQITPLGAYWLLGLAHIFDGLWMGLVSIAHWDASFIIPVGGGWRGWQVAIGGVAVAALLAPKALHLRLGAACFLLILAVSASLQMRSNDQLKVTVLDVGQGLAVVLSRGDGAVVFDTGMAFSPEFNAGTHIVAPYLVSHGLTLETMVVSHSDLDHKGGAAPLYDRFKPPRVYAGQGVELGINEVSCASAPPWQWRGVSFRFLWPQDTAGKQNDNNGSCVLLVEYGSTRFLLPGDIEAVAEAELIARNSAVFESPVDVLVAAHHGSKTSSSAVFLEAVAPRHVIISAGYKNRYGHPHSMVVERFKLQGAQLWMTAEHGAVQLRSDGEGVEIISERERLARRWY